MAYKERLWELTSLICLLLVLGCAGGENESTETETTSPSTEPPTRVAKAIDGTPEVSIATLRKRLGASSRAEFHKAGGRVVAANLAMSGVTDLTPLEGLPLKLLDLTNLKIDSIESLQGMPLVELYLEGTQVTDLSPLKGMPLEVLRMEHTQVADITPLAGMKLSQLGLFDTKVTDLTPIAGMPLNTLWLTETAVEDISILKDIELVSLDIEKTGITDLSPLAGMQSLKRLNIAESAVTDLTPLKGLLLERLIFSPEKIEKGMEIVKQMPTLQQVGRTFDTVTQPGLFWATIPPASSSDAP